MKKICLIVLVVLLLPVTSSFAATATQRIFIPYAVVGDGYWSGLVIHNTSNSAMTFIVCVYTNTGEGHYGTAVVDVQPHAMEARPVENFLGSHVLSVQMSLQILTITNTPFQATLVIGSENGFGFQNYKSEDYLGLVY
jgi:hypothetical protein